MTGPGVFHAESGPYATLFKLWKTGSGRVPDAMTNDWKPLMALMPNNIQKLTLAVDLTGFLKL
jgi:hypothetical protein